MVHRTQDNIKRENSQLMIVPKILKLIDNKMILNLILTMFHLNLINKTNLIKITESNHRIKEMTMVVNKNQKQKAMVQVILTLRKIIQSKFKNNKIMIQTEKQI